MECNKTTMVMCTVLATDHSNLSYSACCLCQRTLPDTPNSLCRFCNSSSSSSKRLFRLLMSIATDTKVLNVICFGGAAKILFGCSADEFFDFAQTHPFAAVNADKILEGEILKMTLSKPKNGKAQHMRAASILPLRTDYQPLIESLRELYGDPYLARCLCDFYCYNIANRSGDFQLTLHWFNAIIELRNKKEGCSCCY